MTRSHRTPAGAQTVSRAWPRLVAAIALTALLTGCATSVPEATSASAGRPAPGAAATALALSGGAGTLPVGTASAPMPASGTCRLGSRDGQPLPDPQCTPGAINPAVTPATLSQTICRSGWTKTVRPAVSLTNRMKAASARSYSLARSLKGEYDHLVSLELGGAPDDPRNLWVEPGRIPNPKDAVENKLNEAICSGLVPLRSAQRAIASDWVTAFDAVGLRVAGGRVCLRANPARCASRRHG